LRVKYRSCNTDENFHNPAATSFRRRVVAEEALSGDPVAKAPRHSIARMEGHARHNSALTIPWINAKFLGVSPSPQ